MPESNRNTKMAVDVQMIDFQAVNLINKATRRGGIAAEVAFNTLKFRFEDKGSEKQTDNGLSAVDRLMTDPDQVGIKNGKQNIEY